MILDSLSCTKQVFEAGTGWALKPEGACKADVCIPLGDIDTNPVDIKAIAQAMNLPLVEEPAAELWALGPDSIGGRTLSSAKAPELELPDVNGEKFKLSSLKGKKVLVYAWAPY